MNEYDASLLHAVLRQHMPSFIRKAFPTVSGGEYQHNWHIDALAYYLDACFERKIKRLLITLPPRSGKSICASVAFPAWALGHNPGLKFICASYAQDLSDKLARDCRNVMTSNWYRSIFPGSALDPRKTGVDDFRTLHGGGQKATSVGGTLTGLGANFIIIDDPMKAADANSKTTRQNAKDWLDGSVFSRLDNKNEDVIILVMQRLHIDDLAGHVLSRPGWTHLNLPAIAETPHAIRVYGGGAVFRPAGNVLQATRESKEKLDEIKRDMGSLAFSAQYQQQPIPPSGNLLKRSWLRFYKSLGRKHGDRLVQSWDTAMKPDELNNYSVCTTWLIRKPNFYLLDVVRKRLAYPELKKEITTQATRHNVRTVLVEDKASGTPIIQDLSRGARIKPIAIQPEGDKIMRLSAQSAKFEAGCIYFPEQAPWLEDLISELLSFPDGPFDDQVDSISQLLAWEDKRSRYVSRSGTYVVG